MKRGSVWRIIVCAYYLLTGLTAAHNILTHTSFARPNFSRHRRQSGRFKCTLPQQLDNGQWIVLNGNFEPGDKVDKNSVLKFECNPGYGLSPITKFMLCDENWSLANVPECRKLCPPMMSTATVTLKCVDKLGQQIGCDEATEGSSLSYQCAPYFETPFGYKKRLLCIDGTWNYPKPVCQPVCGKKNNDDTLPLIFGGKVETVIEYPWVAALYMQKNGKYLNVCGGSLISQRVVLSAAHCVTNDYGDKIPKENYQIATGKLFNAYKDNRDTNAQYLPVHEIIVHSGYKGPSRNYISDIALLITTELFVLNKFVQPVCFNDLTNIHLHSGNIGVVCGWGSKEDGLPSEELRSLKIPYKYETNCAQELPQEWADKYNMIDKICAGFYNKNTSVCPGDSGGGLVFRNPEDNRFYVHGTVSIAPSMKGKCNTQQNSLYTKVAFYYSFVDDQVNKFYAEECILPSYPENGKWVIESGSQKKPGERTASTTKLKVVCNEGYRPSTHSVYVMCESSYKMPTCQRLCPQAILPSGAISLCKNDKDEVIKCAEATDYTTLAYSCPAGYKIPQGTNSIRQCVNGSWGIPSPECIPESTTTVGPTTTPVTSPDTPSKPSSSVRVICSYASWQSHKGVNPEDFNATLCTHVVYAFIGIWPDGNVRVQDDPLDLEKGLYRRVTEMKGKNPNLKVLLSVGGSGASNASLFSAMAREKSKIDPFIASAKYFLKTYNFDGLEIEWLVPDPEDKDNYINLLKELRKSFKAEGYLLTASVRSHPESTGYDGKQMNEILDWISVRTYDMYGDWSSYTGQNSALYASSVEYQWEKDHLNMKAAADNWLRLGVVKNKMVLSVAFYGRSFTLKDKNNHGIHAPISGAGPGEGGGFLRYSEICSKYGDWERVWDKEQNNPYKYHDNIWFGYDDKDSAWIKAAFIKDNGFLGVNVWPVDGDDVHGKCGMKQILLKHIHGGLGNSVNW